MRILIFITILMMVNSINANERLFSGDNFCGSKDKECKEYLNLIGSSFYLAVDDVATPNKTIHPIYEKMYNEINPAGILLTFRNSKKIEVIRDYVKSLSQNQDLPILIGGDNCQVFYQNKNIRMAPISNLNSCQSRLRASIAKIAGCNFLFGPRIEKGILTEDDSSYDKKRVLEAKRDIKIYEKVGIFLTIKHFPFTPKKFDIHNHLIDFQSPLYKVSKNQFKIFKEFAGGNSALMTTHVYNTEIDKDIVTFSKMWNRFIRKDLNFKDNLLVTDSINMFQSYPVNILNKGFNNFDWSDDMSAPALIFIRSIIAGHNLVINREASVYQKTLIYDVIQTMKKKYFFSYEFKKKLIDSKKMIRTFKMKFKKQLSFFPDINQEQADILLKGIINKQTKNSYCEKEDVVKILKKVEIY